MGPSNIGSPGHQSQAFRESPLCGLHVPVGTSEAEWEPGLGQSAGLMGLPGSLWPWWAHQLQQCHGRARGHSEAPGCNVVLRKCGAGQARHS